jgi:hypothetical protein
MSITPRCLLPWVILLLLTAVAQSAETAADLYVASGGNDAWSGRLAERNAAGTDGPIATLQRAKQLVADLRKQEPARERPILVAVRAGTYFLEQPLAFEPDDSGTEKSPTVYAAWGDERPVLSGGVRLDKWQVTAEGRWQTTLDDVKAGKWSFAQLFVNDQRRSRPQLPKQGYYHIADKLPPTPEAGEKGHNQFRFAGDEIRGDWANLHDVEVMPFHQWSASRMHIASVAADEHRVVFTGTTLGKSDWAAFPKGHRYLVINVREALGEPGSWYLDRPTGVLTYVPQPGEQPSGCTVIAPRAEQLVVFHGDLAGQRWVQHVQFRGLTFAHANWTLPAEGQAFPQADIGLNAAIAGIGARNVAFDCCAVRHVGGYAMAFGPGSRHNRIEGCELFDLGGGGIKIGHAGAGTWGEVHAFPNSPEMHVSHHTVRNCRIAHGGRLHPASVGVWVGQSSHNVLEHNEIYDFYYTGFSVGWTWGYGRSDAHHNDVGFNHVYQIGQGVLSDMGGIYTLGIQPGTVIHDNHFHDVQSFGYGGWGLYTDEGSSEIVMENNLVHHCKTGGFHQHYGKENRIQNNIFAFGTEHQVQRTRTEPHLSFTFERNIVYWDNASPLLGSNWGDNHFELDKNVYWNASGKPVLFPGNLTLEQWREKRKHDLHSVVADPLFVDAPHGNYQLQPTSPVLALGFKPFDASQAGRQTPATLTKDLPPVPKAFQ